MIRKIEVLDKGFVELVDWYGSDMTIPQTARISYDPNSTKVLTKDANLIKYLYQHAHSSPFEQTVVTFRVRLPIFVARQIVRHRTARLNELSARYSEIVDDFYIPDIARMTTQDKLNRQGSSEVLIPEATEAVAQFESSYRSSYATYTDLLSKGVNRETARIVLPLATYTEWIWQMDLNNLFKFLQLRMDSHAQWETRQYANAKYELLKQVFPIACEAFEEFTLNGAHLSSTEKDWIMQALDYDKLKEVTSESGVSERAIKEFFSKVTGT